MSVGLKVDPAKKKWKKKALKVLSRPERLEKDGKLKIEEARLLSQMDDHPRPMGATTEEWQRHIMGKDDYARLLEIREELVSSAVEDEPDPEPEPTPTPVVPEDLKKRAEWRKAAADFRQYKQLAERLEEESHDSEDAKNLLRLHGEAVTKADARAYDDAIHLLAEAIVIAKEVQKAIDLTKNKVSKESAEDAEEQRETFALVVQVEDKTYGFDSDVDAKSFHLANSVNEQGGLEVSPELRKMGAVLKKCAERKEELKKKGATIDEIVAAVYKNVPKNFWPNDVVKEVVLFKAVKAEIDADKALAEAEDELEALAEKSETAGQVATGLSEIAKGVLSQLGEKGEEAKKVIEAFQTSFAIANDLFGATMSGIDGGEKQALKEKTKDNPVKEKIAEFERNKAIITCVNTLVSLGLNEGANLVPVLGIASSSKDFALDVMKAHYYFKNTLNLETLKKGAATDPRSAAMLPLARQAHEQHLLLADSTVSAVSNALIASGKGTELGGITAPVGLALEGSGQVLKYGAVVVIQGIRWSDGAKAVRMIEKAIGPPALRRAQIEVMKHSAKFSKYALVYLAMEVNDPWAIKHLENMGLDREDINNPNTTGELIREYMALKAGGVLGKTVSDEDETIEDSLLGKIGGKLKEAAVWVKDKVVGRDTNIKYDPAWQVATIDLTVDGWNKTLKAAIVAGWYDSRPNLDGEFGAVVTALAVYNKATPDAFDACIKAGLACRHALNALAAKIRSVEAVTNDEITVHKGMNHYLLGCLAKINEVTDAVNSKMEEWYNERDFPGLSGEALKQAKQEHMDKCVVEAEKVQKRKAAERRHDVEIRWNSRKVPTPYGSCKLKEFPKLTQSSPLKFDDTLFGEVIAEVDQLNIEIIDRITRQLLATPAEKLDDAFEASSLTVEPLIIETLRALCERLYELKLRTSGASSGPLWQPTSADIALDALVWDKIPPLAKKQGWDQEGFLFKKSTGITTALKEYQSALKEFEKARDKKPPVPTDVSTTRGLLLGAIDKLIDTLKQFQPLTKEKFYHPGLMAYRADMLDLASAARMQNDADFFADV